MLKPLSALLMICCLAACGGTGGSVSTTVSANPFVTASAAMVSADPVHVASNDDFTNMLNGVRAGSGADPVSYDARLGAAAQTHANDMLANSFLSHTGSNGSSVGSRVMAQGYTYSVVGENIARGYADEAAVLNGWVNSTDHQANNVNPSFEDFGLARAGLGRDQYWVLVLATEQ